MTSEWIEVVNDEDIMYLNNMYDDFEDAMKELKAKELDRHSEMEKSRG